jgi:arylformamidase
VWPGDSPFLQEWVVVPGEDAACVSRVSLSPHAGTHVDAPLHLEAAGGAAATVPLEACVGPCEVVVTSGRPVALDAGDLPEGWYPRAPRVLFATGTWPAGSAVPQSFAALSPALVDRLADAGVVLAGVDTPSVDPPAAVDLPAHRRCLGRGVVILEGLDLSGVAAGLYTLMALPLRLATAEASPVRAVLLARADGEAF